MATLLNTRSFQEEIPSASQHSTSETAVAAGAGRVRTRWPGPATRSRTPGPPPPGGGSGPAPRHRAPAGWQAPAGFLRTDGQTVGRVSDAQQRKGTHDGIKTT